MASSIFVVSFLLPYLETATEEEIQLNFFRPLKPRTRIFVFHSPCFQSLFLRWLVKSRHTQKKKKGKSKEERKNCRSRILCNFRP